jgi:hypothetical protein
MSTKSCAIYLSEKSLKNLLFVLDYIIDTEEKSYEEYVFNKFDGKLPDEMCNNFDFVLDKTFYNRTDIEHIYAMARKAIDSINSILAQEAQVFAIAVLFIRICQFH